MKRITFFFLLNKDHENMTVNTLSDFCFDSKTFHYIPPNILTISARELLICNCSSFLLPKKELGDIGFLGRGHEDVFELQESVDQGL